MNNQEQINTLSGGITQFQAIVDAMKVALTIATTGYVADDARVAAQATELENKYKQQVDDATARAVTAEATVSTLQDSVAEKNGIILDLTAQLATATTATLTPPDSAPIQ